MIFPFFTSCLESGLRWGAQRWLVSALSASLRNPRLIFEGALLSAAAQPNLVENANRLEAYRLFASGGHPIDRSLKAVGELCTSSATYESLWTMEGVGYFKTIESMRLREASPAIFSDVPTKAVIPLTTGVGMALGLFSLRLHNGDIRGLVGQFLGLCRRHVRDEHREVAIESFGLVSCLMLTPERSIALANEFRDQSSLGDLHFWHGFGRGLYFSPLSVCPILEQRSIPIRLATALPPDDLSRRNCISGLAWALALVNVRHPTVIDAFLKRNAHHVDDDTIAVGINAALALWQKWAPESDLASRICSYTPKCDVPAWFRHATRHCGAPRPSVDAVLFRYRPLSETQGGAAK